MIVATRKRLHGLLLLGLMACGATPLAAQQSTLPSLEPTQVLLAPDFDPSFPPEFGNSVAVFGKTALVAARATPRVFSYTKNDAGLFTPTGFLATPDGQPVSGSDVVLSLGLALVRADAGESIRVFRRSGNTWKQTQVLTPSPGEVFATGLALELNLAAIGVRTQAGTGAADVFIADFSGKLRRVARFSASDGVAGDDFGEQLALSLNVLAVSARKSDAGQGAVYTFNLLERSRTETQKLTASDGQSNDSFGAAIAFQEGVLAIAAPASNPVRDMETWEFSSGAVYVFRRSGRFWTETQKLVDESKSRAGFGMKVAVNRNVLAVTTDDGAFAPGRLFVHRFDGATYVPVAQGFFEVESRLALDPIDRKTLLLGQPSDSNGGASSTRVYDLSEAR